MVIWLDFVEETIKYHHSTASVKINQFRFLTLSNACAFSGGDRGPVGPVPAPHQHGADLPAAAAGDGHAEAAGSLRAAGGAAAKVRGRAEEGQVPGSGPGGLH